ncbi:MAG TPA: choice-of-anchor tandem repeat GloVer-containing protein [Candidatus Cybelea sp.]|nr:choice-of-anchor tandem repeat GloVer-containing protein [Candidatus Cybelea sp.]
MQRYRFVGAFVAGAVSAFLAACSASQQPLPAPDRGATIGAIAPAASERTLHSFAGGTDGQMPDTALVSLRGEFYGTTTLGGSAGCHTFGCGTVFAVSASGDERVLHAFSGGKDGEAPGAPVNVVDGHFVGTTVFGGGGKCKEARARGCGTIFQLTASGTETVLYRFPGGAGGSQPDAHLAYLNGALYGEARAGGKGTCGFGPGCGLIFKMSPSGRVTVLYTFKGKRDGGSPQGGLVLFDGAFYGTTVAGGSRACYFAFGCGTIFKISPSGIKTTLYDFMGSWNDGAIPSGRLALLDGNLYGTTETGGGVNCGLTYYLPCGTVFKVTAAGKEDVIYNFKTLPDGSEPNGVIAYGGMLYGTTPNGGAGCNLGCGTAFELSPAGQETVLYSFQGGETPSTPGADLLESGGAFYGTTEAGGTHGDGTVYALTP